MKIINYEGHEIKLTSKRQGTAYPWGERYLKQHHRIFITIGSTKVQFEFYCNDRVLGENDLIEAFHCFLSDGIAYNNARNIEDFADEFGYDRYFDSKRLWNAWNGCERVYNKWNQFGIDIYDIANWLQETYNV